MWIFQCWSITLKRNCKNYSCEIWFPHKYFVSSHTKQYVKACQILKWIGIIVVCSGTCIIYFDLFSVTIAHPYIYIFFISVMGYISNMCIWALVKIEQGKNKIVLRCFYQTCPLFLENVYCTKLLEVSLPGLEKL